MQIEIRKRTLKRISGGKKHKTANGDNDNVVFNETQKLKIKRISTDQFLPCGTQTVHILHGPGRDLSFSRRSSVRSLLQRRELNPERKQGARKEGKKRKEKKSRKEGKVEECAARCRFVVSRLSLSYAHCKDASRGSTAAT